jgi:hypothetical protein
MATIPKDTVAPHQSTEINMIEKDGNHYDLVLLVARCGVKYSRIISKEDIPWIKADNMVKRMRKDYWRKHKLL